MDWNTYALTIFVVVMALLAGTAAVTNDSDIIGMAVAGCVSFTLLSVVIGIGVVFFFWGTWFKKWMHQRGKVKMPRAYFQKKEEARKRLLAASQPPPLHIANGSIPVQSVDKDAAVPNQNSKSSSYYNGYIGNHAPTPNGISIPINKQATKTQSSTTLVQSWHQGNPAFTNRIYEEKDATLELGEEIEDDFKIETEVVDNETLDVGPFKHDHSKEVPIKGDVYPDPYIYSTVDKTVKPTHIIASSSVKPTGAIAAKKTVKPSQIIAGNSVKPTEDTIHSARTPPKETHSLDVEYSTPGEIKTSKFEPSLLYL